MNVAIAVASNNDPNPYDMASSVLSTAARITQKMLDGRKHNRCDSALWRIREAVAWVLGMPDGHITQEQMSGYVLEHSNLSDEDSTAGRRLSEMPSAALQIVEDLFAAFMLIRGADQHFHSDYTASMGLLRNAVSRMDSALLALVDIE